MRRPWLHEARQSAKLSVLAPGQDPGPPYVGLDHRHRVATIRQPETP
jgi:hypothetical protein